MSAPVDLSSAVSHAEVEQYMRLDGWQPQQPGPAGAMWLKGTSRIAVPDADGFDESTALGIIRRLAHSESREPSEVARDVLFVSSDVTNLHAANSVQLRDTISLDAAEVMVGSAKAMLRASGTTAVKARSHIRGNYSKRGDEILGAARMAHTVRGSFVIPIVVPLSETSAQLPLVMDESDLTITRMRPEPFERRVTRTLAQSLRALSEVIIEPAKWPTQGQVDSTVEYGVSRELCSAVELVITQRDVAELETSFSWAPSYPAPTSERLSRISISSDAAAILGQASKLLEKSRVETEATLTGTIVEFRWASGDPRGQVSIATIRRGRPTEVHVSLTLDQYEQAWQWHQQMRAVLVEGRVTSRRGRSLRIEDPSRFIPVDSDTLFSDDYFAEPK